MSNKKVEQRKHEKYNRKKIEAAKKRKTYLSIAGIMAVIIAICVFVGYRIYEDYFKFDRIPVINTSKLAEALDKVLDAGYTASSQDEQTNEQGNDENGNTDETGKTDENGNTDESGKTDENGKTDETEKTGENGKTDETEKTGENGNTDESGKTDENGNTDETGKTDESGNTGNTETKPETTQTPE